MDESGRLAGFHRWREGIRADPRKHQIYKVGVGFVGGLVLVGGIIAIPYPGPGWAIVFVGLGILASEFVWAQRVLKFARRHYDRFADWLKRQHWSVQGLFGLMTCAIVIVTLWLLGAIALVAGWFGLEQSWLKSPIPMLR